jgi:molybdopterin converting factor small subunit
MEDICPICDRELVTGIVTESGVDVEKAKICCEGHFSYIVDKKGRKVKIDDDVLICEKGLLKAFEREVDRNLIRKGYKPYFDKSKLGRFKNYDKNVSIEDVLPAATFLKVINAFFRKYDGLSDDHKKKLFMNENLKKDVIRLIKEDNGSEIEEVILEYSKKLKRRDDNMSKDIKKNNEEYIKFLKASVEKNNKKSPREKLEEDLTKAVEDVFDEMREIAKVAEKAADEVLEKAKNINKYYKDKIAEFIDSFNKVIKESDEVDELSVSFHTGTNNEKIRDGLIMITLYTYDDSSIEDYEEIMDVYNKHNTVRYSITGSNNRDVSDELIFELKKYIGEYFEDIMLEDDIFIESYHEWGSKNNYKEQNEYVFNKNEVCIATENYVSEVDKELHIKQKLNRVLDKSKEVIENSKYFDDIGFTVHKQNTAIYRLTLMRYGDPENNAEVFKSSLIGKTTYLEETERDFSYVTEFEFDEADLEEKNELRLLHDIQKIITIFVKEFEGDFGRLDIIANVTRPLKVKKFYSTEDKDMVKATSAETDNLSTEDFLSEKAKLIDKIRRVDTVRVTNNIPGYKTGISGVGTMLGVIHQFDFIYDYIYIKNKDIKEVYFIAHKDNFKLTFNRQKEAVLKSVDYSPLPINLAELCKKDLENLYEFLKYYEELN